MNVKQGVTDANDSQKIADRYQRAQTIMAGHNTATLVQNDTLYPHWIGESDCFWYERAIRTGDEPGVLIGKEYRLVNARNASNKVAFDHDALAKALTKISNQSIDKNQLPLILVNMTLSTALGLADVSFTAFGKRWYFNSETHDCSPVENDLATQDEARSPNGKTIAFVRDYNLWLRDIASSEERALTVDGEEHNAYGIGSGTWGFAWPGFSPACWSPDSSRLLTVRRDKRQVLTTPLVDNIPADGSFRPKLKQIKVAYPGDEHVELFQLLSIDVVSGDCCEMNYPPMNTGYSHQWGVFDSELAWWAKDNQHIYCVELERGDHTLRLLEANMNTGDFRVLFEENSKTHINLFPEFPAKPLHRSLPNTNELIWWSQRSGWGHLYLYDLSTGKLKRTLTSGDWVVRDVLLVDEKRREVFIQTAGRVAGRNPYYRDVCCVNIDTGEITTLASSDEDIAVFYQQSHRERASIGMHQAYSCPTNGVSPTGDYIVITGSRVDQAPVSQLINREGETVMILEEADTRSLPKAWQWPEPISVIAADGETPLYGVLFRPSDFSADKQYPVINFISGDPFVAVAPSGSFNSARGMIYANIHYFCAAALAELGFVTLVIDSRGTPLRSKAFQDFSYGWSPNGGNTDDHVGAIEQLAKRYLFMDINRVGIYSFSYRAGLQNFLERQDFYKVFVLGGSMIDVRLAGCSVVGDVWEGLDGPDDDRAYPEELVEKVKGKMLLIHPVNNHNSPCYPPVSALRFMDALQQANKDFDMLMLPGNNSSYGTYVTRRIWDYFIEHLAQEKPPENVKLDVTMI